MYVLPDHTDLQLPKSFRLPACSFLGGNHPKGLTHLNPWLLSKSLGQKDNKFLRSRGMYRREERRKVEEEEGGKEKGRASL